MKRINIEINELQAFISVAEKLNFKAAAEDLYISQPALSRRIDKLEQTLGARLLDRTTRRVELTIIGKQFLTHAQTAVDELEDAVSGISDFSNVRSGLVTIASIPSITNFLLPKVLKIYASTYPKMRVKVIDESANDVLNSVISGGADFGLNFMGAQEPGIEFEAIYKEEFVLATPANHPLSSKKSVTWDDISQENLITVSKQSGNRMLIDNALSSLKKHPNILYEANHVMGVLALVDEGLGVAVVPSLALASKTHPRLIGINLNKPRINRVLGLISKTGKNLRPPAQYLYDLLKTTIQNSKNS